MASTRRATDKPKPKSRRNHATSNVVAGLAVIGLALMSYADLQSLNNIPTFVYVGMIGAALGAKYDDVMDHFGGRK